MEGFLRSSFLLRLVSFLLLPFKITGQAGVVQRVNRGYRVMTALLALVFCLVFVYIHILYKLCMCVTMCIYSIYPSCVSLFCFCVNWIRVTDVAQSDWKHTDRSVDELPPTSPLLPSPPPILPPQSTALRICRSGLLCFCTACFCLTTLPIRPPRLNHLNHGCWAEAVVGTLVLWCAVHFRRALCVCIYP